MPAKTEKEIRAYFDELDKDGSGKITVAEMKEFFGKDRGYAKTLAFDKDDDDKVTWEEYIRFFRDHGFVKEEE